MPLIDINTRMTIALCLRRNIIERKTIKQTQKGSYIYKKIPLKCSINIELTLTFVPARSCGTVWRFS